MGRGANYREVGGGGGRAHVRRNTWTGLNNSTGMHLLEGGGGGAPLSLKGVGGGGPRPPATPPWGRSWSAHTVTNTSIYAYVISCTIFACRCKLMVLMM